MYDLNGLKLAYLNNGFKDVTNVPSVKLKKHLAIGDNLIMGIGPVRDLRKEIKK